MSVKTDAAGERRHAVWLSRGELVLLADGAENEAEARSAPAEAERLRGLAGEFRAAVAELDEREERVRSVRGAPPPVR
jgi:hypothetical protein